MINPKMQNALNSQINEEFFSSFLYLSMSAYFDKLNMSGLANWMRIQTQEEYMHAMKFYTYLLQKGGTVELKALAQPKYEWKNILEVFEDTYIHEQKITSLIDGLVDIAIELKDHATNSFLQWFVTEQVEEEANVCKILDEFKMVGDNRTGLLMLDRELGSRVFTASTTSAP